jgi:cell division protein FtsQ
MMPRPPSSARPLAGVGAFAVLGVLLLAGLIGAHVWKQDLVAGEVRVTGARVVRPAVITKLAAVPLKEKLFAIDLESIQERVLKHPYVKRASVERDVPNRIVIRIEEREPVAALVGDRLLYVDDDGTILPPARSDVLFDLPVITSAIPWQRLTPGRVLTGAAVREALDVLRIARAISDGLYRRVSEVHITADGNLILYTAEFSVPVILGRGDMATKLAKLESFWNSIVTNRGIQDLASVDVRFEDMVVVRRVGNEEPRQQ